MCHNVFTNGDAKRIRHHRASRLKLALVLLAAAAMVLGVGPAVDISSATGEGQDPTGNFTIDDASVAEGDSGTTSMIFTVNLNPAVSGNATVAYAVSGGTATAGTDYTSASGTVSLAGGATSATVTVLVNGDSVVEADETLTVELSNPNPTSDVRLGSKSTATGTIRNDDTAALTVNDAEAGEGSPLTFTVTLSAAVDGGLTVTPTLAPDTAEAEDYGAPTPASLAFSGTAGETKTFTVPTTRDADSDDETFTVSLAASGAAASAITSSTGTGTIREQNRPPQVAQAIADRTLRIGEAASVDVSGTFTDPDGDTLTYTVASSDAARVTASLSGNTVRLTGVAPGSATVTVTADDGHGGTASAPFTVTVQNRAPQVAQAIADRTLRIGEAASVDVSGTFTDPDGDALTYTVASSDAARVTASLSGTTVRLTGVASGSATVTVTADDGHGGTASAPFTVTVQNRAPQVARAIADQRVQIGAVASVDVSGTFTDPDGDALTYAATSSDATRATASLSGTTVRLTGVAAGSAIVTVTADDGHGGTASDAFTVTVARAPGDVVQVVLPVVARVLGAQTINAIGQRVRQDRDPDDDDDENGNAWLGGQPTLAGALGGHGQGLADDPLTMKDLLADSGFVLPLKAANTPAANRARSSTLTVWGSSAYHRLADDRSDVAWEGDVLSLYLGADARPHPNLLIGVALSRGMMDVDYDDGGQGGRQEVNLTGAHPYVGWTPDRLTLWGTVGYGWGDLKMVDKIAGRVSSDVTLRSAGVGGSARLWRRGANLVRLKTEAMLAQMGVRGGANLRRLQVDVNQLRLSLEASRAFALADGGRVQPLLEIGLRRDGGDGKTGSGTEVIGGLRYDAPVAVGVRFEGRVHTLLGGIDYEEWGFQGLIQWGAPGTRGLSVSVVPGYGAPAGDVQAFWRPQQWLSSKDGVTPVDHGARVDASLGYGLMAPVGLVTPYSELTLGESGRSHRLGLRWLYASRFELELEGEHAEWVGVRPEQVIMLQGRVLY